LAVRALLGSPLVLVSLAAGVVSGVTSLRAGTSHRDGSPRLIKLLAISGGCYAAFHIVGILLAPSLTLWYHRSPLPYWPVVLSAGVAGADHLLRRLPRAVWRYAAAAVGVALVWPDIASDPVRHLGAGPHRLSPAYAEAASAVPPGAVVATNAPLPIYAHYRGGVVRLPNDGESAIADLIVHYGADYLVLFPIDDGCDSRGFLDRFFTQEATRPRELAGRIELALVVDGGSYQVFRRVNTQAQGKSAR
jgi:hypothetical protein